MGKMMVDTAITAGVGERYALTTQRHLRAPIGPVWDAIYSRAWMNALAPVMAPVFRWNHGQVMAAGGRGLAQRPGAVLLHD